MAILGLALIMAGCAETGSFRNYSQVPDWVNHPSIKGGLAASACQPRTLNFSLDQKEAASDAREALGKRLKHRIGVMEKSYQDMRDGEKDAGVTSTFNELADDTVAEHLPKARAAKTGYVYLQGDENACVMMAFDHSRMKRIFKDLVENSDRQIGPSMQQILFRQLTGYQGGTEPGLGQSVAGDTGKAGKSGSGEVVAKSPGDILRQNFMEPFGLSTDDLARALKVPSERITGILNGTRRMSADTALRLSRYFGTSPHYWLDLQARYDLSVTSSEHGKQIKQEVEPRGGAGGGS